MSHWLTPAMENWVKKWDQHRAEGGTLSLHEFWETEKIEAIHGIKYDSFWRHARTEIERRIPPQHEDWTQGQEGKVVPSCSRSSNHSTCWPSSSGYRVGKECQEAGGCIQYAREQLSSR